MSSQIDSKNDSSFFKQVHINSGDVLTSLNYFSVVIIAWLFWTIKNKNHLE